MLHSTLERDSDSARPTSRPVRDVLVIDDHPLFCDALALTLGKAFSLVSVRTAASLREAEEALSRGQRADALVLDLNLPDADGIEAVARLRRLAASVPLTVVSAYTSPTTIRACLELGASGFVPKNQPREEMVRAFRAMWEGEVYVPEDLVEDRPARPHQRAAPDNLSQRLATLTPRQTRILRLVCEGKANKQIAYELSIAETTVKTHVTAILSKIGVHSRTQVALVAQKAGLFAGSGVPITGKG